ncbi:MAG: hypothetical protein PVJ57_06465 [Phycisphaerae bacterium]
MAILNDSRTLLQRLLDLGRSERTPDSDSPGARTDAPVAQILLLTESDGGMPAHLGDVTPVGAKVHADYKPRIGEVVVLFYRSGLETASISGEVIHLGQSDEMPYFRIRFADVV